MYEFDENENIAIFQAKVDFNYLPLIKYSDG
jgi:hypothetical protein